MKIIGNSAKAFVSHGAVLVAADARQSRWRRVSHIHRTAAAAQAAVVREPVVSNTSSNTSLLLNGRVDTQNDLTSQRVHAVQKPSPAVQVQSGQGSCNESPVQSRGVTGPTTSANDATTVRAQAVATFLSIAKTPRQDLARFLKRQGKPWSGTKGAMLRRIAALRDVPAPPLALLELSTAALRQKLQAAGKFAESRQRDKMSLVTSLWDGPYSLSVTNDAGMPAKASEMPTQQRTGPASKGQRTDSASEWQHTDSVCINDTCDTGREAPEARPPLPSGRCRTVDNGRAQNDAGLWSGDLDSTTTAPDVRHVQLAHCEGLGTPIDAATVFCAAFASPAKVPAQVIDIAVAEQCCLSRCAELSVMAYAIARTRACVCVCVFVCVCVCFGRYLPRRWCGTSRTKGSKRKNHNYFFITGHRPHDV